MLLGAIAAAGLCGMLFVLARTFAEEQRVHDLKVRVVMLRKAYQQRLAEMSGQRILEVAPVEEVEEGVVVEEAA